MKILLKKNKENCIYLKFIHFALNEMQRKPVSLPLKPAGFKYDCALFCFHARQYLNHCSTAPTQPYSYTLARTQLYSCHVRENEG